MKYVIWKGNASFPYSLPILIMAAAFFTSNVLESSFTPCFSHFSLPRTQIHGWKDQEGRNGVATLPGINQYSTQNPVILILCALKALVITKPFFFFFFFFALLKNPSKMRINTAFRTDLVAVVLCKAWCPFTAKIEFNAYWSFDRCLKTTLIVIANTCRSTFTCQVLF